MLEKLCVQHWVEQAEIVASPLQAEVKENITNMETKWLFSTLEGDNGTQHHVAHSTVYLWAVLTLTMIGIGLVLIGGWLGRNRLGQCCILGLMLGMICQQVKQQPQQNLAGNTHWHQREAPLKLPSLHEVDYQIQSEPDIQTFRYACS